MNEIDIVAKIAKLKAEIEEKKLEIKALGLEIERVMLYCKHDKTYWRNFYDGSSDQYCSICGKCLTS